MAPERIGSLIGGSFGLIFVLVNTGSVSTEIALFLRAIAVAVFLVVLTVVAVGPPRASPSDPPTTPALGGGGFTRGYWFVVSGEVAAIVVGLVVLNTVLQAPQAAVAWISTVVGVHFVALAIVWRLAFFHVLGGALLLCGPAGLVLASTGSATSAIDIVSGVLPGAVLLGFGLWGATRRAGPQVSGSTQ